MKKKLIILAVAIILLLLGFKYIPYHCNCNTPVTSQIVTTTKPQVDALLAGWKSTQLQMGSTTLHVFMADTPALQEQGLSGVESLPENTGMLFVFDPPQKPGFWMKDMKFDLDMVWISEALKVVGVEKNVKVESYPKAFFPPSDIKYALEVPSGFSDQNQIFVGEKLSIGQ